MVQSGVWMSAILSVACSPPMTPHAPASTGSSAVDTTASAADTAQPHRQIPWSHAVVEAGELRCVLPSEQQVRNIDPSALRAGPSPCRAPELVRVSGVADGDTFHLIRTSDGGEEDVRIIGVDTPEVWGQVECYGPEASDFTKEVLEDRLVWLTFDYDCIDPYDRTLAYVHLSADFACFFERLLLQGGYADVMTFSDTSTWAQTFTDDELAAQEAEAGMWAACQ